MTVRDIYQKNSKKPPTNDYLQLCSRRIYSIIQFDHPDVTAIDIVRTWALTPLQITVLRISSPSDVAVAYEWDVKKTCMSKTFKNFVDVAKFGAQINVNNDTLKKFGKRLNVTIQEMAFLLRRTVASLVLMPNIKFGKLKKQIHLGRLVEQKVARLIELVTLLKRLRPGTRLNEYKMEGIVRNCSFENVNNLTDAALKKIIVANDVEVFTKHVRLETLILFFGNQSLDILKEKRLSYIIVSLMGMNLSDFLSRFSHEVIDSRVSEIERHWGISSERLTLEQLLIASKLMEGTDQFLCFLCLQYLLLHVPFINRFKCLPVYDMFIKYFLC